MRTLLNIIWLVLSAVAPFGRGIVPTHLVADVYAHAVDYER